ncbi:Nucleoporin POM34 [Teratosphaeria destructans]|uniref:Nucleoporin POM34 n=1 Tax=Teratosphaeria destructans TaxID=418781 RepID=A0A9W7SVH9_9PEZI|nr:Nucleoporin POM34 [Teratosphaeria destructans]
MSTTALTTRTDPRTSAPGTASYSSGFAAPATRQNTSQTTSGAGAASTVPNALPKISSLSPNKTPSTPASSGRDSPRTSSTPGAWQHPRLEEVIRRQNATRFDGSNVRILGINVALLAASFLTSMFAHHYVPASTRQTVEPYATYLLYSLRCFFTANLAIAVFPLFRPHDPCEDIPLTPAQRAQLGLPPMTRQATPHEEEQYVTPPRYSRSNTPQSGSSLRAEASDSPLGARGGSPLDFQRSTSNSPFGSSKRRSSFRDSSPLLSGSEFDAVGGLGTPTKSNNRASVGLNNKWLYEKGRASPRTSTSGLAGFGGTGSVFM